MIPKPSRSGATDASVTSARPRLSNGAQFAKTHPVRKCVTGLTLTFNDHTSTMTSPFSTLIG